MTQEHFNRVLRLFLAQKPFRPFTLELVSGGRVEVNHRESLEVHANGLLACFSTTRTRSIFEVGSDVRFLSVTGTT
jgi:hypothetical protein